MIPVVYARQSTDQAATEEHRSLARQEAICAEVAADHVHRDDGNKVAEFE